MSKLSAIERPWWQRKRTLDVAYQEEGITPADQVAMATDIRLMWKIVALIHRERRFTPVEEQPERLLEINERVWKNGRSPRAQSMRWEIPRSSQKKSNGMDVGSYISNTARRSSPMQTTQSRHS